MDKFIKIDMDFSAIEKQYFCLIAELQLCLFDDPPHVLSSNVERLLSDIVLGEPTITVGADEIVYHFTPHFGNFSDDFLATLVVLKY